MLLEIKGRVRLDAFEKFVRELPNSRSRAVMVLFNTPYFFRFHAHSWKAVCLVKKEVPVVSDNCLEFTLCVLSPCENSCINHGY